MANNLKVHEQQVIIELAGRGCSKRRIARELGLDRKTIRRYLRPSKSPTLSTPGTPDYNGAKSPGVSTPGSDDATQLVSEALSQETGRPSLCRAHRELIDAKLEAGLRAKRIYQDLVSQVRFSGSYQSVKRFVRGLKSAAPQRVWRVEVQPGEPRHRFRERRRSLRRNRRLTPEPPG